MLVTFSCKNHENIVMFGDVAVCLLKMMGQSGVVPSAILAEDVPAALDKLKKATQRLKEKPEVSPTKKPSDDDDEREVSMAHRALPLIDLLEDAVAEGYNVMWK